MRTALSMVSMSPFNFNFDFRKFVNTPLGGLSAFIFSAGMILSILYERRKRDAYDAGVVPFLPGVGNNNTPAKDSDLDPICDVSPFDPVCFSKDYKFPKEQSRRVGDIEADRGVPENRDYTEMARDLANINTFYSSEDEDMGF